jgi:hypothetical protein
MKKSAELKRKDPGSVKRSSQNTAMKEGTLKRQIFNGAPDFEKSLMNAGKAAKYRKPIVGSSYRITDGRYAGEMCKVHKVLTETHLEVEMLDAWLKPTGRHDAVPAKYLRVDNEQRD